MRAIIDLDDDTDRILKRLARQQGSSRAQVVREAIVQYLHNQAGAPTASAFGLWKKTRPEGVTYQRQLRKEWSVE